MGYFKSLFSGGWSSVPKNYRHFGLYTIDGATNYGAFKDWKHQKVLTNPAMLKVISLQCDMFSLGQPYVYKNEKVVPKDPFLKLIKRPNLMQQTSQFFWDFMFWNMFGNAYLYIDSRIVEKETNKMYWLDPSKIEWPAEIEKLKDKFILSNAAEKKLMETEVTYRYEDGTTFNFPFKRLICIGDISNGLGNWFKSPSKIDALYKVISNSEAALDSSNINIRYSGKFMVSGQTDPNDVTKLPMGSDEQADIENKVNGPKVVTAVKSMIDIKRYIESGGILKELGEAYLNAYFLIGSMYGIPKDVLEAYNSGTYENQEKARGAHVSYCLQPKANILMGAIEQAIGYDDKNLVLDWEHLPFMQVFAKDRAQTQEIKTKSLLNLLKAGIPLDDINIFLDTEFTEADLKEIRNGQGFENTSGYSEENTGNQEEETS